MNHKLVCLAIAVCGAVDIPFSVAATPQPCPISYASLNMPYKHEGGISTPMVDLAFTNLTRKKIVRAKFGLIVMGPEGNLVPYEKDLTFSAGADAGKLTTSQWSLEMEKVDIHRMGETIYLKNVRFEDNSTWEDDGNQRCRQDVYYGPK
jgi:hypothetical protein